MLIRELLSNLSARGPASDEIRRARYLSVKEAPHNTESLRVSGENILYLFET